MISQSGAANIQYQQGSSATFLVHRSFLMFFHELPAFAYEERFFFD